MKPRFWAHVWQDQKTLLPELVKRLAIFLAIMFSVGLITNQLFLWAQNIVLGSGRESLLLLSMLAFTQGIYYIFISTLWTFVVPVEAYFIQNNKSQGWWAAANEHFNYLLIESVRVLARVLLWLPLFIFPAAFQYLRLMFVPFIVLFDPSYRKGDVDALKASAQLTRGNLGLCFLCLGLVLAVPGLISLFSGLGNVSIAESPLNCLISQLVDTVLSLISSLLLYSTYTLLIARRSHESTVQLARN